MADFVRGRKGTPRPPLKKPGGDQMDTMDCSRCGKSNLQKYPDGTLEKHKVYAVVNGKKTTTWSWCTEKRWRK